MKRNLFARPPDAPALQEWRRLLLDSFLRVALILALPIVLIGSAVNLRSGRLLIASCAAAGYLVLMVALLLPQLSTRLGARVVILTGYLTGTTILAANGIASVGALLLLLTVMLATLLFAWRAALLLTLAVSVTVGGVVMAASVGWLPMPVGMAGSRGTPAMLLISVLFFLFTLWFGLLVLSSLIGRLSASLWATAAANAELEHRVAERTARLDESQRQLQLILRTIPDQLWLKDRAGRYLLVSDALAGFHGFQPAQMLGRTVDELYDPDLAGFIRAGDELTFAGQLYVGERLIRGRWFDSRRSPIYDDSGSLVGLVGLAHEITTRKEAELALARQLRYAEALAHCSRILLTRGSDAPTFRRILDEALEVLRVAVTADRAAVYYYPDWEQDLAYASPNMRLIAAVNAPDLPPHRPVTPEEIADIPAQLRTYPPEGPAYNGPISGRFPDHPLFERYQSDNGTRSAAYVPITVAGRWWGHISVTDHGQERSWDDGAIQLLRTAAEMIVTFSQGWEALQALAASEASLRALHDALPDLIFVFENDTTIISAHAPSSDKYYVAHEHFLGRRMVDVLPEPAASLIAGASIATRSSGQMQIVEYKLENGGQPRVYENRMLPIDAGHILSVVRDVTVARQASDAMLRAKEAAEAADRAKSAFLATMSHEIRTPLNAVLGMADLLDGTPLSAEQRGYVETIRTGGEALLAVISHILDYSRIEAGRVELEARPFNLRACIEEACRLLTYEAANKKLIFRLDLAPELPASVVGDPVRLRQVLINLLSNAVKFTAGGEVSLRAAPGPEAGVRFEVADTGAGVAPDQIERIFEPFFQADSAATRRHGGTGLGLAISRQLVGLMGGTIRAVSTPGVGSTFTVDLPLRSAAPAEPALLRPLRVLVVEDNVINQMVTARYLGRLGHQADVVERGLLAVDALRRQPYDVLLIDLETPELDGLEATRRIRRLGDRIRQPYIIAMITHEMPGAAERCRLAGIDGCLHKPVQSEALGKALRAIPAAQPGGAQVRT